MSRYCRLYCERSNMASSKETEQPPQPNQSYECLISQIKQLSKDNEDLRKKIERLQVGSADRNETVSCGIIHDRADIKNLENVIRFSISL